MPSIINAPLSGGVTITSDTSGVLQLQTASTTALTITAAQNVGVGTASFNSKLAVSGSNFQGGSLQIIRTDTSSNFALGGTTSGAFQIYDVTAGNLTRLVIDSNGDVTFSKNISVGNATPTTSGTGITFPATQSASSDANTLDDYEEGTWTPTSPTSGYTISTAAGSYTKVGRVVTVAFRVLFSAVNAAQNSNVTFSGLPFSAASFASSECYSGVVRENSSTGAIYMLDIQQSTGTVVEINSMDGVSNGSQRTIRINEGYCGTISYFTST